MRNRGSCIVDWISVRVPDLLTDLMLTWDFPSRVLAVRCVERDVVAAICHRSRVDVAVNFRLSGIARDRDDFILDIKRSQQCAQERGEYGAIPSGLPHREQYVRSDEELELVLFIEKRLDLFCVLAELHEVLDAEPSGAREHSLIGQIPVARI